MAAELAAGPVAWPDAGTELSYPDWIVDRFAAELGPEAGRDALLDHERAGRHDHPAPTATSRTGPASWWPPMSAPGRVSASSTCARRPAARRPPWPAPSPPWWWPPTLVRPGPRSLAATAARLDAGSVATVVADGTAPPLRAGSFDRVLVDAPCSGLGVLRRRPDARWRVQPGDVARLAGLQRRLLAAAVPLVRPGGVLVYSVCTLTRRGDRRHRRLAGPDRPGAGPAAAARRAVAAGRVGAPLLLPQAAGTDGMYVLALRARQ